MPIAQSARKVRFVVRECHTMTTSITSPITRPSDLFLFRLSLIERCRTRAAGASQGLARPRLAGVPASYRVIATATRPLPTLIGVPALPVMMETGVTVPSPLLTTYAVLLSGVIATAQGLLPTGVGLPALLVAVKIGVTVFESWLTTSATLPFGVIARSKGSFPTLIGLPAMLVAVPIGVTVSDP
jgi:hypothetical protein